MFTGDSSPDSPQAKEDNEIARMALRCILCNPAITAPMAGLITPQQVDNACLAVVERAQLDVEEQTRLDRAMDRAWANLSAALSMAQRLGIRVIRDIREDHR